MIPSLIREKVLKKYKPTQKDIKNINSKLVDLKEMLEKGINFLGLKCELFVGGSFGKGTFLKDDFDIDIFCRFDRMYINYNLSELTKKILESSRIKYEVQKGSRDYFKFKFSGLNIEVIPVYLINDPKDAQNSTDVSPLHVNFVNEQADEIVKDEIRLAKVFFKSKRLYGAESYIKGFSGHVIDILIIKYRSLSKLIDSAKSWGNRKFIDICSFYESEEEALIKLNSSKVSNLILIDPIIKERNAASALSTENYYKFLYVARKLNVFSEADFEIEDIRINRVLKEKIKFGKENGFFVYGYFFELESNYTTTDIMGAKLLKLSKRLRKLFEKYGFTIFDKVFLFSPEEKKAFILFFFESESIPKLEIVEGPSIFLRDSFENFEKKHERTFLVGDKVCAIEKRKFTKVKEVYLGREDLEKLAGKKLDFIKKIKIID